LKKDSTPTQDTFRQFLNWLDEGLNSGGERYLEMRRRLVSYFDRKNCLSPDELADETLNRVAQKLEDKGSITGLTPAHYCYVVAKFVFLEYLRQADRGRAGVEELSHSIHSRSQAPEFSAGNPDLDEKERELTCLERCLNKLEPRERDLILKYYHHEQRAKIECRAQLAARLGLSMNALSIRACRIRNKLEVCVRTCCREP
jgi:DNA-directed RNA polymerase specialized sigma24 family protein